MPLFPREMESDRLRYEVLHPDRFDPWELYDHVHEDAPHIEEITEWMTWDPYETPKQAIEWVTEQGQRFDDGEAATYVIRPKQGDEADAFAGICGLTPDWDTRSAGLGIWLRKPFWGRGYSGERARRMLRLAFDRLDLEVVAVTHDPENERSRSAVESYIEEFGGRKEGVIRNDLTIGGEPRDSVRYSITREEWAANR